MVHRKQYVRYIMALGHFCVDFTQGTLSAVLPFLIASYHYSYATAAVLVMVSNLIGSVIQARSSPEEGWRRSDSSRAFGAFALLLL